MCAEARRQYPPPMISLLDHPALGPTIFFPRPSFSLPPAGACDVILEVDPAVRLHARIHPNPDAIATIVLFHGNGEVVSDYDAAAPSFAHAGGSLAVIDFRGYGRSEGTPNLRNLIADARPALEALLPHLAAADRPRPIIVMGRSLGSACAAEIARAAPPIAAGIIFESGFSNLTELARRRGLPLETVADEDLAVLSPLRKLAQSHLPLLVLHGENDTLIAPAEGRAAHDASGADDKRFVLIPERGHNTVSFHPLYWEALADFLQRVARASPLRGASLPR
jgi:alpha-beta hydrolase superfamily lysophospholipase